MPDNYIPSDMLGVNPTTMAAMRLDTLERMNKVFSDFQQPKAYPLEQIPDIDVAELPPSYSQYDLFNNQKSEVKFSDALNSDDPDIRNKAYSELEKMAYNTPAAKGLGSIQYAPYDKSQDKYLKGDYGYNPYASMVENEELNYKYDYLTHSVPGRIIRNIGTGLTRFGGSVIAKTFQTFGYMGSMAWNGLEEIFNPQGNNAMADIADNTLSRWAEGWEEDMKSSNLLSVFKPSGWDKMGFFQKLGHGAFWTDEVADGAAFMGEMVLSSYLLGGTLGKIGKLAKFGATPINMASKAGTLGKVADVLTKTLTGAQDISGIGRWAFLTTSESAFEASQLYQTVKENLVEERKKGLNNYSDDQIEKEAGNRAASSFKANMAILSVSNAFENRFIFEPLLGKAAKKANPLNKNIAVKETLDSEGKLAISGTADLAEGSRRVYDYKSWLGQKLNWKDPNSRLRFYGPRALSSMAMEGFWEENAQLATERLATTDSLTVGGLLSLSAKQGKSFFTGDDPQASENIGLGALIGILGTTATSKIVGERRQREAATLKMIDLYNTARREFLSFNDIYKRDGDGKIEVDEHGNMQIDEVKAKGIIDGLSRIAAKQAAADEVKDPLLKKNLQHDFMADYIYASKKAGIFDKVIDRFKNLGKVDENDLMEFGFDPTTTVDVGDMVNNLEEFGKIYDEVEDTPISYPAHEQDKELQRKYTVFKRRVQTKSANDIAAEYEAADADRELPSLFSPEAVKFLPSIQELNIAKIRLAALQDFAATSNENGDFFKDFLETEQKNLQDRIKELGTILKDLAGDGIIPFSSDNNSLLQPDIEQFDRNFKAAQEKNPTKIPIINDKTSDKTLREVREDFVDETQGQTIKDNLTKEQIKRAELLNVAAQNQFISDELSDFDKGWENFNNYNSYIESIQKKDSENVVKEPVEEAPKPEEEVPPPPPPPSGSNANIISQLNKEYTEAFQNFKNGKLDASSLLGFIEANTSSQTEILNYLLSKLKEVGEPLRTSREQAQVNNFNQVFAFWDEIVNQDENGVIDEGYDPLFEYFKEINDLLEQDLPTLSPEEKAIEDEIGKERADEVRAQVKELVDNGIIPDSYKETATNSPLSFLKFVAEQARSKVIIDGNEVSARDKTIETFTESVVVYAEGVFPAKEEQDIISDEEWDDFVNKNVVSKDRLTDIAKKVIAKESLSLRETAIFQGKTSEIEAIIKELTGSEEESDDVKKERIGKELGLAKFGNYTLKLKPEDQEFYTNNKQEIDAIANEVYNDLLSKNETDEVKQNRIATLLFNGPYGPYTYRLEPNDVEYYKSHKKEIDALVRKMIQDNLPPRDSEDDFDSTINEIDIVVDESKKKGNITFVQQLPNEIATEDEKNKKSPVKIVDGALQLKTSVGTQQEQALRQHNVLKKYSRIDEEDNFYAVDKNGNPKFKIRIMQGNEKAHTPWLFNPFKGFKNDKGVEYPFPMNIAVITDSDGNPIHFDLDGNIVKNKSLGQPVAFPFSVQEYLPKNLNLTRKSSFSTVTNKISIQTLQHGYGQNANPLLTLNESIKAGIAVMGSIDMITNGQLSSVNSLNEAGVGSKTKEPILRTVKEMVEAGDLEEDFDISMVSSGDYFKYAPDTLEGGEMQRLKIGQPYIVDRKSNLKIPIRGKAIKDLTIDGNEILTSDLRTIIGALQKDGELIKSPETDDAAFVDLYQFLRSLFYSGDILLILDDDSIKMEDLRINKTPLLDYRVNFNNYNLNVAAQTVPFTNMEYMYKDFVMQNFESGAIPVQLTKGVKQFEKLNKRIIFTLDKSYKDMVHELNSKNQAPITIIDESEFSSFVGKKYKTPSGNTMEIVKYDTNTGIFTVKDQNGKEAAMTKAAFNKAFNTLTEIATIVADEETKESFESQDLSSLLSKEEKNAIFSREDDDLNDINFGC